jgi:serine/threonine-protein kinase
MSEAGADTPDTLASGARFADRYRVEAVLGRGGMGVVYEVIHTDTQRRRALKLMLPQILGDDDMRSRFLREGLVTAKVESEHLVEVFDRGIEDGSGAPYLVMELLRGEELAARVDRGERTSPAELLTMFEQVCAALDKTHAAGIVHRDLKPENLFVTRRDDGSIRMKILDFGIAKVVDGKTGSTKAVGTPLYMAPEQITGQARATRAETDFYAMAHIDRKSVV